MDAVLQPENESASRVLRCADLYCGDGEATQTALDLGMGVVYAYDPSESVCETYLERFGQEPFCGSIEDSIEVAPEFDLLLVRVDKNALAPSNRRHHTPTHHVLEFMLARKPATVVFWEYASPSVIVRTIVPEISSTAKKLGYDVEYYASTGLGLVNPADGLPRPQYPVDAVIATRTSGVEWPSVSSLENVVRAAISAIS